MAILGPSDLPVILKADVNPIKKFVLTKLGHPVTLVEITEDQWESIFRVTGDFVSQYFPLEERYAFFHTDPLISEYDLPTDAYWVREVSWDPATTRIDLIFGAESFLFNIGNISGIQNLLTDYHLLQAYRKFSQKILGTEGQWEFLVGENKIRLYPTPRGRFPVIVKYLPSVFEFNSAQARDICARSALAEAKITVGNSRRKFSSLPSPDGGSISFNGSELASEGEEERKTLEEQAILVGEPLPVILW